MAENSSRNANNEGFSQQNSSVGEQAWKDMSDLKLIGQAKMGSERAKLELLDRYAGLIHSFVISQQRHLFSQDQYPDMFNQGAIGFLKAIQEYDPNKGASLGTYAYLWIKQEIDRYIPKQSNLMKMSLERGRLLAKVLKLSSEGATHDEISEKLGITHKTLTSILRAKIPMQALDSEIAEDCQKLIDTIIDEDSSVESTVISEKSGEALHRWIGMLDQDEQTLLRLRYGLNGNRDHSYDEIAKIMDKTSLNPKRDVKALTRARVMTLCENIEQKLSRMVKREEAASQSLSQTSMFANQNHKSARVESRSKQGHDLDKDGRDFGSK